MKMNLTQVLALIGMTKPVYDARRREGKLYFLTDFSTFFPDCEAERDYDTKRSRYGVEHAVGLAAYNELVARGIPTEDTEYIIGNQFSAIIDAFKHGRLDPGYCDKRSFPDAPDHDFAEHVGAIYFAGGRKLHVGGSLSWCLHEYKMALAEGIKAAQECADDQVIASNTPVNLVLVNVTEIYRRLRTKLLGI